MTDVTSGETTESLARATERQLIAGAIAELDLQQIERARRRRAGSLPGVTAWRRAERPDHRRPARPGRRASGRAPGAAHGHLLITPEDETGLTNRIVRPDLVTQTIKLPSGRAYGLNDWEFVLATGVLQRQGSAVNVVVTKIRPLTAADVA